MLKKQPPKKYYCYGCKTMHRFPCQRNGNVRSMRSFAVPAPKPEPTWWDKFRWWLKDTWIWLWWNH